MHSLINIVSKEADKYGLRRQVRSDDKFLTNMLRLHDVCHRSRSPPRQLLFTHDAIVSHTLTYVAYPRELTKPGPPLFITEN